ncbi:MAG TPA: ImmA/IrrE family metallo-endopeptidase [Firmicutes bacterium]|nr:ImmA/IrrE family metallo-endopeptidase [Bacillota bacterium]
MPFTLLKLAYDLRIKVEYWDLIPPVRGIYVYEPGLPPVIGLAHDLLGNRREFRTVLGEEIGHHVTTVGSCLPCVHYHYSDRVNISRAEYRALRWAANYLMPEDKLLQAFRRGITEIWELAECFDVTEDMVRFRLKSLLVRAKYA